MCTLQFLHSPVLGCRCHICLSTAWALNEKYRNWDYYFRLKQIGKWTSQILLRILRNQSPGEIYCVYFQGSGSESAYVNFPMKNLILLKLIQNDLLNFLALTSTSTLNQKNVESLIYYLFSNCRKKKFSINNQWFSGKILPLYLLIENMLIFLKSIHVWNCSFCEFLFLHHLSLQLYFLATIGHGRLI